MTLPARQSPACTTLLSISGVGLLTATAMLASIERARLANAIAAKSVLGLATTL